MTEAFCQRERHALGGDDLRSGPCAQPFQCMSKTSTSFAKAAAADIVEGIFSKYAGHGE
jgi:hypothetical protein